MSEFHRTPAWREAAAKMRPRIARSLPLPCLDCGKPVFADQTWQLGHRTPVMVCLAQGWTTDEINSPSNIGPSHRRCNAQAGGRLGQAAQAKSKRETDRMPEW